FLITAKNMGSCAKDDLRRFPLDRVVEIHVSGMECQGGIHWDNHASSIPSEVLDLLDFALTSRSVKAVTLEYNWLSGYSHFEIAAQLALVHNIAQRRGRRQ